jgi:hypothetical protein|tara:strand:- start:67 stop:216 length:150 start_codon:yes stop_codon:yes gene_type:complete
MEDGNTNGYHIFHFDGHKVKPQFVPAGNDRKDFLRITLDRHLKYPDSLA